MLHWEAPEGCPDAHDLEREAEQVLGESLARFPLEVSAVIVAGNGNGNGPLQFNLALRMQVPVGEPLRVRELQATSCQELMEAAAVAIALAAAESRKEPPPPVPAPAPDTSFDPGPPEAPPRPGTTPRREPEQVESGIVLGAGALSDWGALPAPGLGAELQLSWWLRWLRVGVGANWLPARSMLLQRGTHAAFGLVSGEVSVCAQQRLAQVQLLGCGVAELGQISAQLQGAAESDLRHTPWRALGVRLSVTYALAPPLEVAVSLAALAPLTRPEFFRTERESYAVHQPAKLGARLWLGLVFSP